MPAGTEAHQLVEVCHVGATLIILSFKPCQIDQQLTWSWLTCIGGNRHVSSPLTVLTLRHHARSHLPHVGCICFRCHDSLAPSCRQRTFCPIWLWLLVYRSMFLQASAPRTPPCYPSMALLVSWAILSSSFVGTTRTFTRLSAALISRTPSACSLFLWLSISIPRACKPWQERSRTTGAFSPMPAVKTRASTWARQAM